MTAAREADLGGDLSRRLLRRSSEMSWTSSPAGGVERKRFHRVGPPEAGQVTSLVRYAPRSRFPTHPHPQGEEILVLEGVFSDARGDWPAGTWLANPEGFEHAPFSEPGCLLFVKLRQYPGARPQQAIDTRAADAPYRPGAQAGSALTLFAEAGFPERISVERWPAGSALALFAAGGLELFVISGALEVDGEALDRHAFLRLPAAEPARARVLVDAEVWVKRDGVVGLMAGETPE
ncbi:MAG TPA: cupin domain-containing protein [Pseudomonadales bacterium]|nr:cupin domain-containing protein [Pseudomonadales bacterium]